MDLKSFMKKVKRFKKVCKKDMVEGKKLAEKLLDELPEIMKIKELTDPQKKKLKELNEMLKLYISNVEAISKIKGDKK